MDGMFSKFKAISTIATAKELVDVALSKTQRKTPTIIHRKEHILKIRKFYMRKVKFCQQAFSDKLKSIIEGFPRIDAIHPFYSDLLNILYDKDHYKLALSIVSVSVNRVEKICKEYIALLKYADSFYKAKMLKTAALGRMCTMVKKLSQPLRYLEEVRQHIQRLPQIHPSTRSLILAGYPNVGKSSFMNLVSSAGVDVQPWAFTTKSLFVGHFDYSYVRWQVIDTPGILDHPLEERNLIEMLTISALSHVQASIIFMIDISEEGGYSIDQQLQLFKNIAILFQNKPILVVLNKIDRTSVDSLPEDIQQKIKDLALPGSNVDFIETSTLTGKNVDDAKNRACDMLLKVRVEKKASGNAITGLVAPSSLLSSTVSPAQLASSFGHLASRLYVTQPEILSSRPPFIPDSVVKRNKLIQEGVQIPNRKLERDIEEEGGGPGVYSVDLRKKYILEDSEWNYDMWPEIFNGKNVSDYVDPEISAKLELLEEEESMLLEKFDYELPSINEKLTSWGKLNDRVAKMHRQIKKKRLLSRLEKKKNGPRLLKKSRAVLEKDAKKLDHFKELGNSFSDIDEHKKLNIRGRSTKRRYFSVGRTEPIRAKETARETGDTSANVSIRLSNRIRKMQRSRSCLSARTLSTAATNTLDSSNDDYKCMIAYKHKQMCMSESEKGKLKKLGGVKVKSAIKMKRKVDRLYFGKAGESDRFIGTKMPKHLFSGKRSIGKTDRR